MLNWLITRWNKWVLLAAIFIAAAACLLTWFFMSWFVFGNTIPASLSAEITEFPVNTLTPTIEIIDTPSVIKTPEVFDDLAVGAYVQITGTEGVGLNIRSGPGKNNSTNFVGMENEVFLIIDGPVETDGYIWWQLEAPYDENRNGWAVSDFLLLFQQGD
jgi:hypothetical protein